MRYRTRFAAVTVTLVFLACVVVGGMYFYHWRSTSRRPKSRIPLPPQQFVPTNIADAIWSQAAWEVYRTAQDIEAEHKQEAKGEAKYSKLARGNTALQQVTLTFDDGPHPQYTPQLLAILQQENVKASFFVVGEMALQYPDLVKAEIAAGHTVCDHTFHHVNLTQLPVESMLTEWKANQDAVQSLTGQPVHYCRPPGGNYNNNVMDAAASLGMITVLWTDNPGDYLRPSVSVIEQRVLENASNGGIILLHDGVQQTVDALPSIIRKLKERGYQFVTLDQMWADLPNRVTPEQAAQ